jgi:hypothetical protein
MYAVNYWGSKPGENDDCWQGFDYENGDEAQAFYNGAHPTWVAWIEIDGPDIHAEKQNPVYKDTREADDAEWRREMQREDAMLHGVEGWNAWEGM